MTKVLKIEQIAPNEPVAGDLGRRAGKLVAKPQMLLRPPSQAPEPGALELANIATSYIRNFVILSTAKYYNGATQTATISSHD